MAGMGEFRKSEENCEPKLIKGDNVILSDLPVKPKNMLADSPLYNQLDNAPLSFLIATILGLNLGRAIKGQPTLLKIAVGTIVADGSNSALKPIEKEYYKDPYSSYALETEVERDAIIKKRIDYPLTFISQKFPYPLSFSAKQIINFAIGKVGPGIEDAIKDSTKKDEKMGPRTWR